MTSVLISPLRTADINSPTCKSANAKLCKDTFASAVADDEEAKLMQVQSTKSKLASTTIDMDYAAQELYIDVLQQILARKSFVNLPNISAASDSAFVIVGCGARCSEMIASLKTLAVQQTSDVPWDVWSVVDERCSKQLDQDPLLHISGNFKIRKLAVSELSSAGPVSIDLFHQCASARLWVPDLLNTYKHMLYVDSDTLVTDSIEPVFQMMKSHSESIMFMAEELVSVNCKGCGWYHSSPGSDKVMGGVNGYNSGTLGINCNSWHQKGMTEEVRKVLQEAKAGKVQLRLGDQDVLNLLVRRKSSILHELPCEFNMRTDSECRDGTIYRKPVILHGNRGVFHDGHHPWYSVANRVIGAADTILQQSRHLSVSLWEAAGIDLKSLLGGDGTRPPLMR